MSRYIIGVYGVFGGPLGRNKLAEPQRSEASDVGSGIGTLRSEQS
jgi:hypothetical protein